MLRELPVGKWGCLDQSYIRIIQSYESLANLFPHPAFDAIRAETKPGIRLRCNRLREFTALPGACTVELPVCLPSTKVRLSAFRQDTRMNLLVRKPIKEGEGH